MRPFSFILSSLLLLLLFLSPLPFSASFSIAASSCSSGPPPETVPCERFECGAMPMLVRLCPGGRTAGYTCGRMPDGHCGILAPKCPPLPNNTASSSPPLSPSTSSPSPSPTSSPSPTCPATSTPAVISSPTASRSPDGCDAGAATTRPAPIFNCSRAACGPSLTAYQLTCPHHRIARPLCSWLPSRQHCGYLDASCDYPEPAQGAEADCVPGGCVLPQYVRQCPGGGWVRPECQWVAKVERCLAVEPKCEGEGGGEGVWGQAEGTGGGVELEVQGTATSNGVGRKVEMKQWAQAVVVLVAVGVGLVAW